MQMTEWNKTGIFAGVAVLVCAVYLAARPKQETFRVTGVVGKALFEDFEDPTAAASLEIVTYDEDLAELRTFEVSKNSKTGLWTIPSNDDYPADAEDRIRDVATGLVGVIVQGVASQDAGDHELYGVLEPDAEERQLGDKGVGLLVRFEDKKGKELGSVIIGKPVKGSDGHRFVRKPGQDAVYDIEVDPDRFSTKFEDWIEKDLLGINTMDVAALKLKDYSVVPTTQGLEFMPRFDALCNWNSTDSKWEMGEFVTYRKKEPIPSELLDGEELNKTELDDLKNNLDDLKIVDVRRKPEGLRADLRADAEFLNNTESQRSLQDRGYYVSNSDPPEIVSANGELHVYMKDGYEYLLRFGNVSGTATGSDESSLNRYLLVTALLDESKFPKPELEEVPKLPEAADVPPPPAEADKDKADPAEKADVDDANDDANDDADAGDATEEEEKEETELEKEIKRIERENQRKLDEWEEKRDKAKAKVNELNARFADWYYVVSEDVYKKLRLSRSDLIKESDTPVEEGTGVDAFRKLQEEGLPDKSAEAADNAPPPPAP